MKQLQTYLGLLIAINIFAFANISYCQTTLSGTVMDKETSETMPFTTIAVYQQGVLICGTDTDFDGTYLFSNLEAGTYDVEASFVGYAALRMTGVIVMADKENILNFEMVESGEFLDEIAVVGYRTPLISRDHSYSGGTINSESIKTLPTKNINALAATVAGLSTVNGDDIHVRGSRNHSTYVYIDGVRVKSEDVDLDNSKRKRIKAKNQKTKKQASQIKLAGKNVKVNGEYSSKEIKKIKRELKRGSESYNHFVENAFTQVVNSPLSTFSIDVDRASYSNMRRFVQDGNLPPKDAVRIEEMINYFDYDISAETNDHPIGMSSTLTECPWNGDHQLLHLSMNADDLSKKEEKPSNFVFLVDVSGSMGSPNKLPLVIQSLELLVDQMKKTDRIAIVTYAGRSTVALPSTLASEKSVIVDALKALQSGGSTAGAEGILTAYKIASENFIKKGNNRVILATDGDFNVGTATEAGLEELIEEQRESDIFLTVLGYGMGNYKDDKMQILAQKGNGNNAYIDNIKEARKILMTEFAGTLYTVAKDVKIQIEFNPAVVETYRLIGYESRLLEVEDFDDDQKDAGEIGAGHHVTAIYEVIPVGAKSEYRKKGVPLKYLHTDLTGDDSEVCTIKMRYKKPSKDKSIKFDQAVLNRVVSLDDVSSEVKFALGVAECGLLLRESEYIADGSFADVLDLISDGLLNDPQEERAEFQSLVETMQAITASTSSVGN